MKQVLLNLLGNGVKYTRSGGFVKVNCQVRGESVRVAIRDSGIGIAPAMLPRVFTPFDRLGAERTGVDGTGLGLALSRRLVQAMNGTIGVESTQGKGSCFWFDLGRAETPVPARAPFAPLPVSRLTAPVAAVAGR